METFHSDDKDKNNQNLSTYKQDHTGSALNSRVVGVAYSSELNGIQEDHEFFQDLDELFEADCGNYTAYKENLDSIKEEYNAEIDQELSTLYRDYMGDNF